MMNNEFDSNLSLKTSMMLNLLAFCNIKMTVTKTSLREYRLGGDTSKLDKRNLVKNSVSFFRVGQ